MTHTAWFWSSSVCPALNQPAIEICGQVGERHRVQRRMKYPLDFAEGALERTVHRLLDEAAGHVGAMVHGHSGRATAAKQRRRTGSSFFPPSPPNPPGHSYLFELSGAGPNRKAQPRTGYAAIRCGVNSRPFSTTSTTAREASVQRKKPVANGNSVPS
jgi:hypothetical protein